MGGRPAAARILYLGAGLGSYPLIHALRHGSRPVEYIAVLSRPGGPAEVRASRWVDEVITSAPAEPGPAVLAAARRSRATHVIPTDDRDALLLTALAPRLAERSAVACAGSRRGVLTVQDKAAVIEAAEQFKVPVPRLMRFSDDRDALHKARELGYPLILKARSSHAAEGVRLVRDESELLGMVRDLRGPAGDGGVTLHEYVHGGDEPSVTAFMGADGTAEVVVAIRKRRYAGPSRSCALATIEPPPETAGLLALFRGLGLRGPVTAQLKRDPRDGRHKLLEINARLGQNAKVLLPLLRRGGLDPAERFLRCFDPPPARSAGMVPAAAGHAAATAMLPPGREGVSVLEDVAAAVQWWRARTRWQRPDNPVPSAAGLARSYLASYASLPTLDAVTSSIVEDYHFALPALRRLWPRLLQESPAFIPWGGVLD
jgi:D-aspartate ligase